MQAFQYASPSSLADAVKLLAGTDNCVPLAGGTDLINRMKDYVTTPSCVVNLRGIKDLAQRKEESGVAVLGANVRLADLAAAASSAGAPMMAAIGQAALEVGTPQIRNMATLGGNLLQRPRCWYFRNGFGLLGKVPGASEHAVRAGDNRYGPIFMTDGDALFVNTSSLAPPLIAAGAKAVIATPNGERTIDVAGLYRVPTRPDELELTLAPGEVLKEVRCPLSAAKAASYEVRLKQSHDWPIVLCSVALEMQGDRVSSARVVLGSVAPIPYVCTHAAEAVTGKAISPETAAAAGKAAVADARPLSMNAYKVKLTEVAVKRALLSAAGIRDWEA